MVTEDRVELDGGRTVLVGQAARQYRAALRATEQMLADPDYCPQSRRVDGKSHSWRFDGDDPRIICVYCDQMRDALTSRVIRVGNHGLDYHGA